MTIDEAIKHFEEVAQCNYKPTRESAELALTALHAQQEAEKNENGCKYCRDGEIIAWDMCNDAVTIQTDGRIHIIGGGDWECEINYCPMCGRQLRRPPKEAHNV